MIDPKAEGTAGDCLTCRALEGAYASRRSNYIEARSAAYYRVSTEFTASKNVDMERAKSDLEEHKLVCVSAAKVRQSPPRSATAPAAGPLVHEKKERSS